MKRPHTAQVLAGIAAASCAFAAAARVAAGPETFWQPAALTATAGLMIAVIFIDPERRRAG